MKAPADRETMTIVRRHLRFGWWSLLVFLSLGIVLEALHGFKVGAYLNVSNATRRLMWTLAHAHGTLLALVHVGFAFTVRFLPQWAASPRQLASASLRGATVLIPCGFFLAGFGSQKQEPGFGIVLVPVGALLLISAVVLAARSARAAAAAESMTAEDVTRASSGRVEDKSAAAETKKR